MNYTEIKDTAFSYADRTDVGVTSKIDNFLRIVEARMNRYLSTHRMSVSFTTPIIANQFLYVLPPDFLCINKAKIRSVLNPTSGTLLNVINKDIQVDYQSNGVKSFTYAIKDNAIELTYAPLPSNPLDTFIIDMSYVQMVAPLTATVANNWMSDLNPDCYIFGLLTEINAFVKDAEAAKLWSTRFIDSLEEIKIQDNEYAFGGSAMQTLIG